MITPRDRGAGRGLLRERGARSVRTWGPAPAAERGRRRDGPRHAGEKVRPAESGSYGTTTERTWTERPPWERRMLYMPGAGRANGHGRPVLRLDQVAPESLEIWIPVDPDIAFPPAFVAEEDPR